MIIGALANPPKAQRPTTPGQSYGVPAAGGELIAWDHVMERLNTATAYWLATISPDARPHVVPVWGVMVSNDLYLEIGSTPTAKSRNLDQSAQIQVHLDDVDDVIIIRGLAEPARPTAPMGAAIAAAMRTKYANYMPEPTEWDESGLIRVVPRTVLAWRDMPSATRWRFERPKP